MVLVSIWSQWPYFTGWLGNVCEKSQWSTIYLLHHLGFCIFLFFFYILFALFCHISGDGIAATKSTIFPLAPSWLLHFSLFCVLKYFFALLCHISEDGLAAKIPNDLQFISLSKFFIAKPILFSSNCFFVVEIICIFKSGF